MVLRVLYLIFLRLRGLLLLLSARQRARDVELLAFCHENTVLRRQLAVRPRLACRTAPCLQLWPGTCRTTVGHRGGFWEAIHLSKSMRCSPIAPSEEGLRSYCSDSATS